jgi:60 kDa SS-A/Ro ribonucleoprotein
MDALSNIRTRNAETPQTEQADSRQVQNNAGGYVFEVAGEDRIKRFLCLGVDGGTYYQREKEYTKENAQFVIDFAQHHGSDLVLIIRDISTAGRAPRQNPALFALAAVFTFGDSDAKKLAAAYFNDIVRTGTHLFTFVSYAEQFRGWGRVLKKAVGSWYLSKDAQALSYQLVKYRQRNGWTHRDVLRSAHVGWKSDHVDLELKTLFDWAVGRQGGLDTDDGRPMLPGFARPYEIAKGLTEMPAAGGKPSKNMYANLIREFPGLPWEALPDEALTFPETWEALIDQGMPITALIRQLPRLTNLKLNSGATLASIVSQLTDADKLRKGRVHPVKLLYALKTYAQGHGVKGNLLWAPDSRIINALDDAFYLSFKTMEPAGKRTLLALDVSGSMNYSADGIVSCAEGATAMAMATAASEPGHEIMGFSHEFKRLDISPRRRLDDNMRTTYNGTFGSTDCSLPMKWALGNRPDIETFVVYTDNETYAGRPHPHEALRLYRNATGINAKLIVVGMTASGFTIADPDDSGMLDVAGFDADTPSIISGFSRGDFS